MWRVTPSGSRRAAAPTRRVVCWISALALLSYALTAGPIMLRMAAAHAGAPTEQTVGVPCPLHAGHAHNQHPAGHSSLGDHEHCLFCQGGVATGLIAVPAAWAALSFEAIPFAIVRGSPRAIRHIDAGYAPRAPPRLT
ncbi:MAG TPA: DUF2946 family protein [Dongiaceae bacterium]